jgi:SAM-dependent methyltransferase
MKPGANQPFGKKRQTMTQPETSYDPEFFEPLFAIEDRHFWFQARNRMVAALTRQATESLEGGFQVMEIGFGTGNVLRVLESVCDKGRVYGMDLFDEGGHFARSRVSVPLIKGDVLAAPFGSCFDLVCLFDVLEHIGGEDKALKAVFDLLKPGGRLLLTVPAFQSLWSYFDEAAHHVRRYSRQTLINSLRKAGFEVEFASYTMMSIFPLVWAGRRLASLRRSKSDQPSDAQVEALAMNELRVTPLVNPILAGVLGLENLLTTRRIELPFGTSLVALARRSN